MGIRHWHVARADYHKRVADHLRDETKYEDWALVALYYSALQFVDSVLADDPDLPKDERHPKKHSGLEAGSRGRHQLVKALLKPIYRDYRSLEELSRRTRYDAKALAEGGAAAFDRALPLWQHIEQYARMMHMTRLTLPSDLA